MVTINAAGRTDLGLGGAFIRALVVSLTLATALIHASLGGMLFTANALAYPTLAVAMVVPGPIGRIRWLVRVGLIGFTAATIGGWLLFGARFPLAYLDKAIEVGLVAATTFELWRVDGGPLGVVGHARRLARGLAARKRLHVPR
jgi:hypothetical protein